jgi:hypothetical protein
LIPGERDSEFLWGVVLAASGCLGVAWLFSGLPTPLCPFHALTGIPCPSCGMTRGLRCLLHGNLTAAFLFNPLGMTLLCGLAFYLIYAAVVVIGNRPRLRWEPISKSTALFLRLTAILLIVMNWMYLILRERALVGF